MRVIDVDCHLPEPAFNSVDPGDSDTYPIRYARFETGSIGVDYLQQMAARILRRHQVKADDIDLIVSLSLAPDHLIGDTSVMGPKIGHPFQSVIGANKAFVFDLMESSLAKALSIINTLAIAESYSNILVIRYDNNQSFDPDPESGFISSDGAAIALLEADRQQIAATYPLNLDIEPLSINLNTKIKSANDKKGQFSFAYHPNLQNTVESTITSTHNRNSDLYDDYVIESWIGGDLLNAGPFTFFQWMKSNLETNSGATGLYSYDPFASAIDFVTLTVSQAKS
ncbi:hypothetical protein [Microbulbifer sp. HZ11]|uniref:hypothetical protein n=1 Tax=unclassified Microbulbifer TaxID=2619833 RepID=UPI0005BDEE1D|nr:hypothetical protein [Microbulbifer sp. HZ11]